MKLQTFIINVIGIVILILLLIEIYKTFIRNNILVKNQPIAQQSSIIEEKPFILSNDLVEGKLPTSSYEYIKYSNMGSIYEPFDSPPMFASGNNKASVTTIDNMRDFLEVMWTLTAKDETKDTSYNFCNKFAELSTAMPSTISDLRKLGREEIYKLFSAIAHPTTPPMTPQTQPPPIPIIKNNGDYVKFLTLCIRSTFLPPFVLPSVNINNKLDRKNKEINARNLGVVDCANQLFIPIKNILNHFHNQYLNNNNSSPGDTAETASLSLHDSCASNGMSYRVREFKQPGKYLESAPSWARFIQVLVIGAGGGGGGGSGGCDTGRRGHKSCGGGGGPSGNSGAILFTTQKIKIEPSIKYNVTVGAGGKAGDKGPSNTSQGVKGEDTIFTMNDIYMKVIGANGGPPGSPGYCNRDTVDAKPSAILQQPTEVRGKFEYVVKKSIQGNIGKRGTPHWHRIWDTVGGQNGKTVFVDNLPELKLPNYSFFKVQKKYGYGGNGGEGQTSETTLEYHLLKLANPGGSGYVCVFFFAE